MGVSLGCMGSFVPHTAAEIEAMLGFLGLDSLDDLFAHIPAAVRLAGGLAMEPGRSEADVLGALGALADRNRPASPASGSGQLACFAGLRLAPPNHLGVLEDVAGAAGKAHAAGGLLVAGAGPVAGGLLRPVGEFGADVAVGEGQPLGTPLAFGGPYVGLFAVKQAPYVRRWLPGRLVGEGEDTEGRRAYVLTLSTREQHIRRAGASSHVCTNQTLIAVTTAIHMAWLGPQGLRDLALRCARGARYAKEALVRIPGVEPATAAPSLYEFAVRTPRPT